MRYSDETATALLKRWIAATGDDPGADEAGELFSAILDLAYKVHGFSDAAREEVLMAWAEEEVKAVEADRAKENALAGVSFAIGDRVIRNPATWQPNAFDAWGRGIGIGVVVDPPFPLDAGEVDVRWPAGRCFECAAQLLPAAHDTPDEVKP